MHPATQCLLTDYNPVTHFLSFEFLLFCFFGRLVFWFCVLTPDTASHCASCSFKPTRFGQAVFIGLYQASSGSSIMSPEKREEHGAPSHPCAQAPPSHGIRIPEPAPQFKQLASTYPWACPFCPSFPISPATLIYILCAGYSKTCSPRRKPH